MAMRKRIDEPERLKRFIENKRIKSEDFKALVLLLVEKYKDVGESQRLRIFHRTQYTRGLTNGMKKRKWINIKSRKKLWKTKETI